MQILCIVSFIYAAMFGKSVNHNYSQLTRHLLRYKMPTKMRKLTENERDRVKIRKTNHTISLFFGGNSTAR